MVGIVALMALVGVNNAEATQCGTPMFFPEIQSAVPAPAETPPPSSDKAEREAHGGCAGSMRSTNFLLKWGSDDVPSESNLEQILDALETSWSYELYEMGHAQPYGSTTHLFNVYVGDTGDCAPTAMGMGGYYTVDPAGWPMIVLSQMVFDDPMRGRSTVAHEFYHAVQHAEQAYLDNPATRWWWEATASWVEGQVYPSATQYFSFLFGYAFEPFRQLNSYTYPSEGRLEEYHQYGAAIWPRYLTEFVTDWTIIRDSWSMAEPGDDPVEILTALMGEELDDHFADFAAHNATWDYFHGDEMEDLLDATALYSDFGGRDQRIVAFHNFEGTAGDWESAPESTLPQRFGYNVIRMRSPEEGKVTIRFRGDEAGARGSLSAWSVRVVRELSQRVEYHTMDLLNGEGELTIDVLGTERAVYLVASVTSPAWNEGESFDYEYQLEPSEASSSSGGDINSGMPPVPAAVSAEDIEVGCQCGVGSTRGLGWALLLPLIVACRRNAGQQLDQ